MENKAYFQIELYKFVFEAFFVEKLKGIEYDLKIEGNKVIILFKDYEKVKKIYLSILDDIKNN